MNNVLKYHPTVCAVGNTYQIMITTWCNALLSVRVGNKVYYNHSNGIRISSAGVQRFVIPMEKLDKECSYTVISQGMMERCPYFPKTREKVETTYSFKPLEKTENINICHLADVHGYSEQAVKVAEYTGKEIDLLILNGDISSSSNTVDDITLCYEITGNIAKGEIPCIISRGNHDLRGYLAETVTNYMPTQNGKSYYTFKVGCIWGIVIDTGEDKLDSEPAYGETICCHEFRLEEDEMIKEVIKNSASEYEREDIKYKIIVSHVPFTFPRSPLFDIERDLYTNWSNLLKENVKPQLMLCGHTHKACISEAGSEYDKYGQPCTIIVGSEMDDTKTELNKLVIGALINLNDTYADVVFNNMNEITGGGKVEF
ncbi:MAG: metallophosphoesterase [Clostridia bacterium]|nr:metallophosphoesterase [Clostridia bacterium]